MPDNSQPLVSPADVPGFVCAYRFAADGSARKVAETDIDPELSCPEGEWLWLHLNFIDQRCARWLARSGRFSTLAIDFIEHIPTYQLIECFAADAAGSVADLRRDFEGETHETCRLHFLLGENVLVTLRAKPIRSAELIRRQLDAGRPRVAGAIAARLLRPLCARHRKRAARSRRRDRIDRGPCARGTRQRRTPARRHRAP